MKVFVLLVSLITVVGCTSGDDATPGDPAERAVILVGAPGVSLEELAIYQGVKRTLVGTSTDGSGVPIVAGRDALLRVFVLGNDDYNREPVTARLTLQNPGADPVIIEETLASLPIRLDEASMGSTINMWLSGDLVTTGTRYRVELLQDEAFASFDNQDAAFPADGSSALLEVELGPRPLEIVLVPVVNGGRQPDVSESQLELYRAGFMDQYPATEVNLSVRGAVSFDGELSADREQGWDELLNAMSDLRVSDAVGPEVYYYGIFQPAPSYEQYCPNGCVLGLGFIPDASDTFGRVAIGIGYTGQKSVDIAVHEIGHSHGRQHAPCLTQEADPAFPNPGASIGSWGFSMSTSELKSPSRFTDFMGYCQDTWVSDYTFAALYDRMRIVDQQQAETGAALLFGRVLIGRDGESKVLSPVTMRDRLATNRSFRAFDANGQVVVGSGHFIPYDHLDGGVLLIPNPGPGSALQLDQLSGLELNLSLD